MNTMTYVDCFDMTAEETIPQTLLSFFFFFFFFFFLLRQLDGQVYKQTRKCTLILLYNKFNLFGATSRHRYTVDSRYLDFGYLE